MTVYVVWRKQDGMSTVTAVTNTRDRLMLEKVQGGNTSPAYNVQGQSLFVLIWPSMEPLPFPVSCPLHAEMETAVAVALEASPLIMQYYRQAVGVDYKEGQEPVTIADRVCSKLVATRLQEAFPQDAVLSEEEADDLLRLDCERVWIVDPLDGTQEFIAGLDQFVIMIGLAIQGQPQLGVVLQPATGQLFLGIVDWGAFVYHSGSTRSLRVSAHTTPRQMRVAVSRSHLTPLMENILSVLDITKKVRIGSVGLKIGLLLTQQVDGYFHASRGIKEWDLCGPAAILLAAGGMLTDCWGRTISFNQSDFHITHGLVATNGLQHDKWVDTIKSVCEAQGYTSEMGFALH